MLSFRLAWHIMVRALSPAKSWPALSNAILMELTIFSSFSGSLMMPSTSESPLQQEEVAMVMSGRKFGQGFRNA